MSGFEALRAGGVLDASHLLDRDMVASIDELIGESLDLLRLAPNQGLVGVTDIVGGKLKPDISGITPYQTIPEGWNEETELGFRLPNPLYPAWESASAVIQVSDIPDAGQPEGRGLLSRVNELGHRVGEMAIVRARQTPELEEVADELRYYETRVVMNATPASQFSPKHVRDVLMDPHTDGGAITWAMHSTQAGLQYLSEGRFVHPDTSSFFLAGRSAGPDIRATSHRVVRSESSVGRTPEMDELEVSRVAVIAFMKSSSKHACSM